MKIRVTLFLLASSVLLPRPAAAVEPDIEIYGTLYPFTEYVGTSGPTARGHTGGASQVPAGAYTGLHDSPRFRMTAGTSNIGFRGGLPIIEKHLKLIWQVESAVPIDGNGPPNTFASRNSHVGFAGDFGSLIFGIWDTPYKWQLATGISPLRAGYVTDFTPIISTPGFGVGALNSASSYAPPAAAGGPANASNAAFHRREANSIQYWSPKIAGFALRLGYVINEGRNGGGTSGGPNTPGINPWLFSGSLGWEGAGFKIGYAFDLHHDYFGMASLGGAGPAPSENVRTSTDMGHDVLASYTLTVSPDFKTRIAATGELLSYKTSERRTATNDADINQFSRPAVYGLIEQSVFRHHVWVAYGQAFQGKCQRLGGDPCSTAQLGAKYATLGYLFAITEKTNVHLIGYRVFNDPSARYATFPALSPIAPGADQMGVGIGIIHAFSVPILGEPAKDGEKK